MFLGTGQLATRITVASLLFFPLLWTRSFAWLNLVPSSVRMPSTPPSNVKILILPGFGNDQKDYFLQEAPEGSLVQSLQGRGWLFDGGYDDDTNNNDKTNGGATNQNQIRVLPVARSDWLKVFTNGVFDWDFWIGEAPAKGSAFGWYLDCVTREIQKLCQDDNDRVVLLGHSAGGWLARAALGYCGSNSRTDANEDEQSSITSFPLEKVLGLVTLGTPHLPPPPSVMDVTRGALRLTHETFPNDFHAPDLFYITVMGQSVRGARQVRQKPWEPTTATGFAYESYQGVCGDGSTIGDGVVPGCAGHLTGATQIDLAGVLHSINAPANWYGSTNVLDSWHSTMMDCIIKSEERASSKQPSWVPQLALRE